MLTLGFIAPALILVHQQETSWIKAHEIVSLWFKFHGVKSDLFSGKMHLYWKTLKIKGKVGNFTVLESVYIKQFEFFRSNDNSILTLAFKIAYSLFDMSSILIKNDTIYK